MGDEDRVVRSGEFALPCGPAEALPLFTPEGERAWVPGWAPDYLSGAADEAGAVWRTSVDAEVTWITTDQEDDRVRYARVSADGTAGLVEVRVSPDGAGTRVRVTYDLTATSPAARATLADFAASFDAMLVHWRDATTPLVS